MNRSTCFLLAFSLLFAVVTNAQLTATRNFVSTSKLKKPAVTTQAQIDALTVTDRLQSVSYIDGLGRPLQSVAAQSSPGSRDIIVPAEYDAYGREIKKFLPYTDVNGTGYASLRTTAYADQAVFYTSTTIAPTVQKDINPFIQTLSEFSPLSTVKEQGAAGQTWQPGSGHAIQPILSFNSTADDVKKFAIAYPGGSLPSSSGSYTAGQLIKNITKDESANQVVEFKDLEGKVILKKVQLAASVSDGYPGWLCTYYVYDEYNQLRFVLPPKATEAYLASTPISSFADELCFRYEYDSKNRMIIKKIPGAGEVLMVYDKRDRLVMTQDALQRTAGTWIVIEYDNLNRPLRTNKWTNSSNRTYHQGQADGIITPAYTYPATISGINEILTENYYDDYTWVSGTGTTLTSTLDAANTGNSAFFITTYNTSPVYAQQITASYQTRGMATGSKTKVLGTASQYLYMVMFYDDKGRVTQTQATNITGQRETSTTQYSWDGKVIRNFLQHSKGGTLAQNYWLVTKMDYDHAGRLLTVKKTFNGGTEKTVATNMYDELGQLKTKTLGAAIEALTYDYNIRGWLLGINRNYLLNPGQNGSNKFGFELAYDQQTSKTTQGYAAAQYNGNITGMAWKSDGDDVRRIYNFSYDNANRLMRANFKQQNPDDNLWNNSKMNYTVQMGDGTNAASAYDANGNIVKMVQYGWKLGGSIITPVDNLTYNYTANSNKLLNVIDANNNANTKLGDFRTSLLHPVQSKTSTTVDYTYDGNGNLKRDLNKDIGLSATDGILYNHLNLPQTITVYKSGGLVKGTIAYTYDAGGNKLKKVTTEGATVTTTLYLGSFNYINDVLQFTAHEEGRIRPKTIGNTTNGFVYDYFIRDHLGNTRMVLTDDTETSIYPVATMETAAATNEELYYANLPQTRTTTLPSGYPANTPAGNAKVAKVSGAAGSYKVGPAITLKVMAGDKFNVTVNSWWQSASTPGTPVSPLADLITALAGGMAGAGGKATAAEITNSGVLSPGATQFLSGQAPGLVKPKAYLNWVLFDEQFKYVSSNSSFEQVDASGVYKTHTKANMPIDKNGYLYIYVSNETPNIDVFFDNLQVSHVKGPLIEETHYYPFGLTMAGISSRAAGSLDNKRKFNSGTELNNDFDINLYETNYRSLDPQLGRFWQIDPMAEEQEQYSTYAFANNIPILLNDPLGLSPAPDPDNPINLPNIDIVSPKKEKFSGSSIFSFPTFAPTGITLPSPTIPIGGTGTGVGTGVGTGAGIGVLVWARTKLVDYVRKAEQKRWHLTYYKVGRGGKIYVGRCSGFGETPQEVLDKYDKNHRMNQYGYGTAVLDKSINGSIFAKIEQATGIPTTFGVGPLDEILTTEIGNYAVIRGREQQLYDDFKLKGFDMGNSINPVWKYNPYGPTYWGASTIAFGQLRPYGATY